MNRFDCSCLVQEAVLKADVFVARARHVVVRGTFRANVLTGRIMVCIVKSGDVCELDSKE